MPVRQVAERQSWNAARTPGREVTVDRADSAPVAPDPRVGTMGQADEPQEHGASQRMIAGEAQQAHSAAGDGARDDWSRSRDSGPSR